MIKTIKKGRVKHICDVCKTKFSYEPEDILSEYMYDSDFGIKFKIKAYYIECPQCKKKNKINKEIVEIIK